MWSGISASPGTSPEGRRGLMSFFRKSNVQSAALNGASERESDENVFGEVDLGGNKKVGV